MINILLTVLIPLALSFSGFLLVSFNSYLIQLPFLLVTAISTALGLAFVLLPLTLAGLILPFGFTVLSRSIFILTLIFSISGIYRYLVLKKINVSNFLKVPRITHTSLFISLFVLVYLSLFLFKPVVDSDVVDSYLPLARSIILADKIPTHNHYDNRPFIIPPAGGPVLFAYYYAVAGNTQSEVFRFINLPFFLGFLILTYFILREYFSEKLSLLGVLVVLSTPLFEDFIFLTGFYPDFIFAFMACLGFLLITKMIRYKHNDTPSILFVILGNILAVTFLLKYQALFLWIILGIPLLVTFLKKEWKYLLFPLIYTPWLLSYISGSKPFQPPHVINYILFGSGLTFITFYFLSQTKVARYVSLKKIFITLAIGAISFSLILRVFFAFSGVDEKGVERSKAIQQEQIIGVVPEGGNLYEGWVLFLASSIAVFWLVPKVIGIWRGLSEDKFILPLFILTVWYSYWVLLLGSTDTKWLFPILPYVTFIILLGLENLFKKTHFIEKVVYAGIPFFLLSSKFLFWNLGVIQIGASYFRQAISASGDGQHLALLTQSSVKTLITSIIPLPVITQELTALWQFIGKMLYILTSRISLNQQDIPLILAMSLVFFVMILFIAKLFTRFKLGIGITMLVLGSYSYIFWGISGGNIMAFGQNEQNKLFDYWGQSTYIVPYLQTHASSSDQVVVFSIPTGLSYYTGLTVYNLEYGGGLSLFYPIFDEKNPDKIYQYFKDKHIRFVIIRDYGDSKYRFKRLKQLTKIFDILDDPQYAKLVISPDSDVYWRLYEIN